MARARVRVLRHADVQRATTREARSCTGTAIEQGRLELLLDQAYRRGARRDERASRAGSSRSAPCARPACTRRATLRTVRARDPTTRDPSRCSTRAGARRPRGVTVMTLRTGTRTTYTMLWLSSHQRAALVDRCASRSITAAQVGHVARAEKAVSELEHARCHRVVAATRAGNRGARASARAAGPRPRESRRCRDLRQRRARPGATHAAQHREAARERLRSRGCVRTRERRGCVRVDGTAGSGDGMGGHREGPLGRVDDRVAAV